VLLADGAPPKGAGLRLLAELLVSLLKGVNVGGRERSRIVCRERSLAPAESMPFWQPVAQELSVEAIWQVFDPL